MTVKMVQAWLKIKEVLKAVSHFFCPNYIKPSILYIYSSSEGLKVALCQMEIMDGNSLEGAIVFISGQLEDGQMVYGLPQ